MNPSGNVLTFGPPHDSRPTGLTFTSSWWCRRDLRSEQSSVTVEWYPDDGDAPDWSFEVEDVSPRDDSGESMTRLVMHSDSYRALDVIPKFFAGLAQARWPHDCSGLDDMVNLLCRLGAQPRRAPWDDQDCDEEKQ